MTSDVIGRWAPSPTGSMHVGNARTAWAAWLSVRAQGGRFLWRVEDLDQPRVVAGRAAEQARDLAWLGLDWDEGPWSAAAQTLPEDLDFWRERPDRDWWQSRRCELYEDALRRLDRAGRVFPCNRSRRELEQIASAPHGGVFGACAVGRAAPYPADLRPQALADGWLEDLLVGETCGDPTAAVRLRVEPETIRFDDRVFGRQEENPADTVGDFVLRRRDGVWAYQLAVVVDDAAQGITEVVRGADLIDSTARQIVLQRALGVPTPDYAHLPLLLNADGDKLNKRDGALELRALRERGVAPEWVVGWLAWSFGWTDQLAPCRPDDWISRFDWEAIDRQPRRVPADLAGDLLARQRS